MSTDDPTRFAPLEFRIPLGSVVDTSTPPNAVSRNPGPNAITGGSPGLSTGAPRPIAGPTLPDPSDPQAMSLLFAQVAGDLFGGGSTVPTPSVSSLAGSPHGLGLPGSPGFSPTLIPGPAPMGADLSNPINAGVPSGSMPTSSMPSHVGDSYGGDLSPVSGNPATSRSAGSPHDGGGTAPASPHSGGGSRGGGGGTPSYGGAGSPDRGHDSSPSYGGGSTPTHQGAPSSSSKGGSSSSGLGGTSAPGYGNQSGGIPSSSSTFIGGQHVPPREGGAGPTSAVPHGLPPAQLTPAYSGGTPSAPPGVIHEAPKPSVPSTRHATAPVSSSPFGDSALDLSSLGLSPLGLSSASSPFDVAGMDIPMVDTMPGGSVPYFMPGANALGLDSAEPRIEAHEARPGTDSGLVRDLGGTGFDPYRVRKDFPILEERVHGGKRLVWLDNAATTQKPQAVIDRMSYFYAHENSNVHRAAHALAARATDAYESARESVRRFINAPSTKEIVWVRGATEGINLVAQTWGRRNVGRGDEIVITHLEHHANIVPWQMLCAEKGAKLKVAPVDDRGDVILEEYEKLMSPRTRLVAIPQVSNALGTITPTREMVEIAHRYGAHVLVDGAQSVSHMRVDVQQLDCEWFVFSGHKVFAPTGIGAVYGKREVLENSPPWQGGGNMIEDVTFEKTRYQPAPSRFEAGTGSIGDAVGLGAALDYVSALGIETIDRYEHELMVYGTRRLATVPGLTMIGTSANKAGVLSFVLDGQRTEDISALLDKDGIAVRSGHHCAQPILRRFGLEATVRASLAFYNVCEDIDALVESLHRLQSGRG
ncbi:MAG: putative cysteine desulfurase [Myxococcales bacterium]|nr:putative cysteine desulfurase [Myxococcales bacterium]